MTKRKSIYDGMTANDLHVDWDDPEMAWIAQCFAPEPRGPMVHSKDRPLPHVHYTNDYWNTARLIYGKEQKCAEVNYSDRLWQWDSAAAERASKAAPDMRTPAGCEAWLSAYHGRAVQLRYIMAGCNAASGYAYYVYGYDYV